jgi:hypothetical protein
MEEVPPLLQLPGHTQTTSAAVGWATAVTMATTCSCGRGGGFTAAVDGNVPGNASTAAVAAG